MEQTTSNQNSKGLSENLFEDFSSVLDLLNVCIEKKTKKDFSDPIRSSLSLSLCALERAFEQLPIVLEAVRKLRSKQKRISSNLKTDSSDFGLFHYIACLIPLDNDASIALRSDLDFELELNRNEFNQVSIRDSQAVAEYLMTWLRRSCTYIPVASPRVFRLNNTLFVFVPVKGHCFFALVHADSSDLDNKVKFIESFDIPPLPF